MIEVDEKELFVMLESKQVREKLTDQQVADKIGVHRVSFVNIRKRKSARNKVLIKIAELCEVRLKSAVPEKIAKPKPIELSKEQEEAIKKSRNSAYTERRRKVEDREERKRLNEEWGMSFGVL